MHCSFAITFVSCLYAGVVQEARNKRVLFLTAVPLDFHLCFTKNSVVDATGLFIFYIEVVWTSPFGEIIFSISSKALVLICRLVKFSVCIKVSSDLA